MPTVKITANTRVSGRQVKVGEIIEVSHTDAHTLISIGKAVPVADSIQIENRDADITAKSTTRSKKKRGKKKV
mgnify:CR=1 FL=1